MCGISYEARSELDARGVMGANRDGSCLHGATVMEGRGWREIHGMAKVTSEGCAKALWKKR